MSKLIDRVIEVIQYLLNTVNRPEIYSEEHGEFFKQGKDITNLQLSRKVAKY